MKIMTSPTSTSMSILFTILLLIVTPWDSRAVELTFFNWDDFVSEEVLDDFTKKTGVTINQVYFDSDRTRDEMIASAPAGKFDIIVFDNVAVQIFGKNNKLMALSSSMIPNLANVDKQWQETCGNFGIPYFYGTVGIVYNTRKMKSAPESWADLLKPDYEHKGHIQMLDDGTDILIPPLIFLGYSINSEKSEELKAAYTLLLEQSPAVTSYYYALATDKDALNDLHMALAFSGDQFTLNEITGTEDWSYVIPREGTAIRNDWLSNSTTSRNKQEALQFLNYMLTPEVTAKNTEEVYNSSPVGAIRSLISKEAAEDLELFPPQELLDKAQLYRILSDNSIHLRRRMLDTLKRQHEAQ